MRQKAIKWAGDMRGGIGNEATRPNDKLPPERLCLLKAI